VKLSLHHRIHKQIATLSFVGYLPYAPGTFGSAAAALFVYLWNPSDTALLVLTPVLLIIGIAASHSTEKVLGKDSGHIVIDEVCGYLVTIMFVPRTIPFLIGAFVLFRIFDIIKPPPVRQIEKAVPGGAGVMLDDVMAGIYANLCIQLWLILY
jgi:phosphatidylglycerophosphatase A